MLRTGVLLRNHGGLVNWVATGALLCLLPGAAASGAEPSGGETIEFLESYQETLRRAKLTQRPIFLEFRCAP